MVSFQYIDWNFDPVFVSLFGLDIRYYGLMWALALLAGGWLFSYFCRRENRPQTLSDSAFMFIVLGTILGSRIGHCLFYEPQYYLSRPWAILTEFRDGGMASHGAAIGIIVGIWLTARRNHVSIWWVMDRLGIIAPLSGAIIRLGNLFNSEIVGHVTTVPWAFRFLRLYPAMPVEEIPAQHPTQLYEALWYFALFGLLWWIYHRTSLSRRYGFMFGASVVGIFLFRFLVEFIKVEQEAFEKTMTFDMGQWLSVPFILVGGACLWYSANHEQSVESPRKEKHTPSIPRKVRKFRK